MPLQATSGAASYDAFGGGAAAVPNYIEDVFSTWLYDGSNSATTITNGIDLSTKGGLVWTKCRSSSQGNHLLIDTVRGVNKPLRSNETGGQYTETTVTAFNSNGYNIAGNNGDISLAGRTFASWTFRKQPKFFDVVTWNGDNTSPRSLPHSLDSVPGFIAIKCTSSSSNWICRHRSLGDVPNDMTNNTTDDRIFLNLTNAAGGSSNIRANATTMTIGGASDLNASGETYVAYLFAHNAGGFGLSGTDNVISCGSFTTNGSGVASVNLGYEPQWAIWKRTDSTSNWNMVDNMRGWGVTNGQLLSANTSNAESANNPAPLIPNATGFSVESSANATFIYIAIRRGPMKTPTTGTSVFAPIAATTGTQTTGFPIDMMMQFWRTSNDIYANTEVVDRLRGVSSNSTAQSNYLLTTSAGGTDSLGSINASLNWTNTGFDVPPAYAGGSNGFECFRRAPGFMDVCCYTGTGANRTVAHNLGVAPELMIIKSRSASYGWPVYSANVGNTAFAYLNDIDTFQTNSTAWNDTSPTSSVFTVGTGGLMNDSGVTYVAYLFASCPGVSKVGGYTGNGSSQTINCGFTGGARFVLIKRTSSTGNWCVWDSARGIVSGNDPTIALNLTNAEATGYDFIDTDSSGFIINQVSAPGSGLAGNMNVNGATYIFLAIA